jgi:hypothetical protein
MMRLTSHDFLASDNEQVGNQNKPEEQIQTQEKYLVYNPERDY